jgi:DNA-binding NarL/FixJ family response regulator
VILTSSDRAFPRKPPAVVQPRALVIDRLAPYAAALAHLLGHPSLNLDGHVMSSAAGLIEAVDRLQPRLIVSELAVESLRLSTLLPALAAKVPPVPLVLFGEVADEALLIDAFFNGAAAVFTREASPEAFVLGVEAVLTGNRVMGASLLGRLLATSACRRRAG